MSSPQIQIGSEGTTWLHEFKSADTTHVPAVASVLDAYISHSLECEKQVPSELRRSKADFQILFIWNYLMCEKVLHTKNLTRDMRMENARRIWDMGEQYCWRQSDEYYSFYLFTNVLHFVGLSVIDPNEK